VSANARLKRVLALEWDARHLRVVHARLGKKEAEIDRMFSARIPTEIDPHDPEQMGHHIKRVLAHEGISTRHVLIDIPRDQVVLNTLSLPYAVPEELPGMVEIQIAKELTFPVSEAVIDFAVASVPEEGAQAEILVATVRKEVLQQYEAIVAAAGLRLVRVGLRPYASRAAVNASLGEAEHGRVLFVDVRPTFTEVNILRDRALGFSRAASVIVPEQRPEEGPTLTLVQSTRDSQEPSFEAMEGGGPGFGVGSVIDSLVMELSHSMEAYRAQDLGTEAGPSEVSLVVLGGDSGIEPQLAAAIQKRLGVPTRLYNPASTFGWPEEDGAEAGAFAATLGLVLAQYHPIRDVFDFLNPKQVVSASRERLRKVPLVAAVVVLFVGAGFVLYQGMNSQGRQRLETVEKEIKRIDDMIQEHRDLMRINKQLESFEQNQHVWVDVMYDLVAALPNHQTLVWDQIVLSEKDRRVELKTRGKERNTASQAVERLNAYQHADGSGPRFEASWGSQSEKPGEDYPYTQDLVIKLLDPKPSGNTKESRKG
jgi:type IV pilus assembly protein PilM